MEPPRSGGLADAVFENAARDPGLLQCALPDEGGGWRELTAARFRDEVLALAKGLLASGVAFGDRVAVMSRTRYEWTLFAHALWTVGAQLVAVYPTSSAAQLRHMLATSGASTVVVEHEDHAMTLGTACGGLPALRRVWQLDADCVRELTEAGREVPEEEVHRRRGLVTPDATAAIVHTSGTTGEPRGCAVQHSALAFECDTLLAGWRHLMGPPGEQPSVLAFLPMSHIYGLVVSVLCIRGGVLLGHQTETAPDQLLAAFQSFAPTCLFAVPYVFEKIYARARAAAARTGHGRLFDRASAAAMRYARLTEQQSLGAGPGPGARLRAQHALYDRLVHRRLRQALGGRARHVVSGGSPLSRRLGLLFSGAGITVYDGYGLTETTAAVTAQPPGRPKFGTVGRPVPGAALHIAADGEIWVRGEMLFSGYTGGPWDHETKDGAGLLYDGWLATGDQGRLDDDGYLILTGRKKDVIVTSGGHTVSPYVLEERLCAHPLVSQALVVGDGRPYVTALITLDPEAVEQWTGVPEEELERQVARAVAAANSAVSRAESIRAFRILPQEFSEDTGLMTPSMKVRRDATAARYAHEINALYARSATEPPLPRRNGGCGP